MSLTTYRVQVHPFSVMLGAVTVAAIGLLAGTGGGDPPGPVLPQLLEHVSIVYLDDGQGGEKDLQ